MASAGDGVRDFIRDGELSTCDDDGGVIPMLASSL
jgi:hypothetical protein